MRHLVSRLIEWRSNEILICWNVNISNIRRMDEKKRGKMKSAWRNRTTHEKKKNLKKVFSLLFYSSGTSLEQAAHQKSDGINFFFLLFPHPVDVMFLLFTDKKHTSVLRSHDAVMSAYERSQWDSYVFNYMFAFSFLCEDSALPLLQKNILTTCLDFGNISLLPDYKLNKECCYHKSVHHQETD